jgi:hypothetical protein
VEKVDPSSSPSAMTALCLCFCALHTNEIPRTDPLVQVDYVRVVDLDIGASKSDSLRDQSSPFPSAPAELEPATAASCKNGHGKHCVYRSSGGLSLKNNAKVDTISAFEAQVRVSGLLDASRFSSETASVPTFVPRVPAAESL